MNRISRGFVLPAAIFILVVLAALGAYIVNISAAQRAGLAIDVLGERAYQAAFSGREWARYQISTLSACPPGAVWEPISPNGFSLAWSGTETLDIFSTTIECRLLETTKVGKVETSMFEIRVTACNLPQATEPRCPGDAASAEYVERQFQALIGL